MLPGPTYIYECSNCHGLFSRRSTSSGNTFFARYRSDGRMDAPMLPTTPLVSACLHCRATFFGPTQMLWPLMKHIFQGFLVCPNLIPSSWNMKSSRMHQKRSTRESRSMRKRHRLKLPRNIDRVLWLLTSPTSMRFRPFSNTLLAASC